MTGLAVRENREGRQRFLMKRLRGGGREVFGGGRKAGGGKEGCVKDRGRDE